MHLTKSKHPKESTKSYLGISMKFGSGTGPSTSIAKYRNNNTNILEVNSPSSTTSHKINIKSNLMAKKKMWVTKKNRKQIIKNNEAKNYKTIKNLLKNSKKEWKTDVRKVRFYNYWDYLEYFLP